MRFFVYFPCSHTDNMPRNTTGGSGHKAQRNSEGSKARHNREFIDDLLADYRRGEKVPEVNVGRVLRRMGCGRMEVFYIKDVVEKLDEESLAYDAPVKKAPKVRKEDVQQIIPMRGLDEAFASLDYKKAREIEDSILELKNVTIINVSHLKIKENLVKYDIIYSVNNKSVKKS